MQLGSLVGFGMVFLVVAWVLSLTATGGLRVCRTRLLAIGPAAERRAVELVAAIPVVIAVALVAVLLVRSQVGVDHCEVHDHHAHLCLAHGDAWTDQVWAVVVGTLVMTITLCRFASLAIRGLRQRAAVARLRRVARREHGVWWVDTAHALCFVSGFRAPEIFVSTGVWAILDETERAAMLAHERAHVRQRDVARRFVLDLLLIVGAPFAATLRQAWDSATERLCDARAASDVGDAESVASAMVKVYRLGVRHSFATSFTPPGDLLAERVEALLDAKPAGDPAAKRLLGRVVVGALALVVVAALNAEALHHLLESLLG